MIASLITLVLGILVTLSATSLGRPAADRLLVCALLGPAIALSSVIALRFRKSTYVAAAAGFLLAVESMLAGAHGLILPVDMTLGLVVMALALYPVSDVWAEGPPTYSEL